MSQLRAPGFFRARCAECIRAEVFFGARALAGVAFARGFIAARARAPVLRKSGCLGRKLQQDCTDITRDLFRRFFQGRSRVGWGICD